MNEAHKRVEYSKIALCLGVVSPQYYDVIVILKIGKQTLAWRVHYRRKSPPAKD